MTTTHENRVNQIPQMGLRTLVGVVLPLLCLWIELAGTVWKDMVFDPLPTGFHIAAVADAPGASTGSRGRGRA